MKTFILFELLIILEFLPGVLGYIFGFKSLWLLPLIIVLWIATYRAFDRHLKKKARRVRADGHSCKRTIAENIIPNIDSVCQDGNRSRSKKLRKEVYIYD